MGGRRQREMWLRVAGLDVYPDVGDVLVSPRRVYLIVDVIADHPRRIGVRVDVYSSIEPPPDTDGAVWEIR